MFLYYRLGRGIVLVKEDQLSLAIGRRGQNVRLASKLVGWDIEIMTHDELNEGIERAVNWFTEIPNVSEELVEAFIEEGFLSYDDLTFLEPAELAELAGVTEEQAAEMIAFAEEAAETVEVEPKAAKTSAASSATSKAVKLLGGEVGSPVSEAKQTFERLFAPVEGSTETPAATEEAVATEEEVATEPPATSEAEAPQPDAVVEEPPPAPESPPTE